MRRPRYWLAVGRSHEGSIDCLVNWIDSELQRRLELALLVCGKALGVDSDGTNGKLKAPGVNAGQEFGEDVDVVAFAAKLNEGIAEPDVKLTSLDDCIRHQAVRIPHLPIESRNIPSFSGLETMIAAVSALNAKTCLQDHATNFHKQDELLAQLINAMSKVLLRDHWYDSGISRV